MNESMNLDETMQQVRACATRMDAEYGSTVFDEWVVVLLRQPQARVLAYSGPRGQEFRQNFSRDLGSLKGALLLPMLKHTCTELCVEQMVREAGRIA